MRFMNIKTAQSPSDGKGAQAAKHKERKTKAEALQSHVFTAEGLLLFYSVRLSAGFALFLLRLLTFVIIQSFVVLSHYAPCHKSRGQAAGDIQRGAAHIYQRLY